VGIDDGISQMFANLKCMNTTYDIVWHIMLVLLDIFMQIPFTICFLHEQLFLYKKIEQGKKKIIKYSYFCPKKIYNRTSFFVTILYNLYMK
jgi:hypothetical protein